MEWIHSRGRVVVDAKTLMLAPLLRIYNDDKTEHRDTANRYLAYIHLVAQIDQTAPYFRASHLEVRQLAKKQLFGSADFEFGETLDKFLEETIKDYRDAYEEEDSRAERVMRKKIDEMLFEIDSKKPQIVQTAGIKGQVIFVSNVDLINKAMLSVPKLIEIVEELKAKVKKMNKDDAVIRAGKRESVLIKRDNRIKANPTAHEKPQATPQGPGEVGSAVPTLNDN